MRVCVLEGEGQWWDQGGWSSRLSFSIKLGCTSVPVRWSGNTSAVWSVPDGMIISVKVSEPHYAMFTSTS